jgi:hypothetical protein
MQTRWLSAHSCLQTLLRVFGATLNFLQDESAPGRSTSTAQKAKELLDRMRDCKTLLGFRVIIHLTEQLFFLSKKLQKRDITYEEAFLAIEVCQITTSTIASFGVAPSKNSFVTSVCCDSNL